MAQIREYNRQVDAVGPIQGREVSAASLGGGGQALEFAGKALGHVAETIDKVQSQDDVIEASKQTSEFYLRQTQKLEDLKSSGKIAEDGAIQKYQEEFDNEFSGMAETMKTSTGKRFMAERQASYSQHFGASFIKQSAEARGIKAKTTYEETLKNKGNALLADPDAFENTLKDMQQTTAELRGNGTMEATDVDALQKHSEERLAVAAVNGQFNKDPSYAKGLLVAGYYDKFISPEHKDKLITEATARIKGVDIEAKRVLAEKEHARAMAADAQMSAWLPDVSANKLTVKQVYANDMLNFREKVTMQNMINKTASGLAKTDPHVAMKLYQDIRDQKIVTPDQIDILVGEGLSPKDAIMYRNILKERVDPETGVSDFQAKQGIYKEAEKRLGKDPIAGLNPEAQSRMNSLRYEIEAAWIDGRKRGIPVKQLTDPKSSEYIGQLIGKYIPDANEIFQMKYGAKQSGQKGGATGIAVADKPAAPKIGEVKNGYMYMGGNPADKNSWEKK